MDDGMTLKGIKKFYENQNEKSMNRVESKQLTDQDVRRILRDELDIRSRF